MNFLERTLAGFLSAVEHALDAEDIAKANGLLQRLDPRVKVVGILILIVAAATAHKLWVIGAVFAVALVLAASSRVSPLLLARRVWIPVLLFTGIIALPAPFVIPGRVVARLPGLGWPLSALFTCGGVSSFTAITSCALEVLPAASCAVPGCTWTDTEP